MTIGSIGQQMGVQGLGGVRPPEPAMVKQVMDSTTAALGLSRDDLRQAVASGQSLTELAADTGVSRDDLVSSITSALREAGFGEDASQLAERLADVEPPSGRPPAGPPPGARSGFQSSLPELLQDLTGGDNSLELLAMLFPGGGVADTFG